MATTNTLSHPAALATCKKCIILKCQILSVLLSSSCRRLLPGPGLNAFGSNGSYYHGIICICTNTHIIKRFPYNSNNTTNSPNGRQIMELWVCANKHQESMHASMSACMPICMYDYALMQKVLIQKTVTLHSK